MKNNCKTVTGGRRFLPQRAAMNRDPESQTFSFFAGRSSRGNQTPVCYEFGFGYIQTDGGVALLQLG